MKADFITELQELLDKHAEYYIKETVKFFQENGESPALSKNNKGDLEARNNIIALIKKNIPELPRKEEYSRTWIAGASTYKKKLESNLGVEK